MKKEVKTFKIAQATVEMIARAKNMLQNSLTELIANVRSRFESLAAIRSGINPKTAFSKKKDPSRSRLARNGTSEYQVYGKDPNS